MGLIERSDLALDYNWSTKPGETPIDKDEVNSAVFDSQSGEDVLSLLNNYAEKNEIGDKDEVLQVEALLRNELPKDLNTEEDIMDWLWAKMRYKQESV